MLKLEVVELKVAELSSLALLSSALLSPLVTIYKIAHLGRSKSIRHTAVHRMAFWVIFWSSNSTSGPKPDARNKICSYPVLLGLLMPFTDIFRLCCTFLVHNGHRNHCWFQFGPHI